MKPHFYILFTLLILSLSQSCSPDKIEDLKLEFTASNEMPLVADIIDFTVDADDQIKTFNWNFGDGTETEEKNPSHSYSAPGTFTVTLAGTFNEESKSVTKEFVVQNNFIQPTASFNIPTLLQSKCPITFTSTSLEALEYAWDFGDGNTSEVASPTHTYETAGTYNIALTVKNGDLEDEDDMSVIVNAGTGTELIPETESTVAVDVLNVSDGYIIGAYINNKTKLYKKDNIGNTVWTKIIAPSKDYRISKMELLPNGNIVIAATSYEDVDDENFAWMIIDQSGDLISEGERDFGGEQITKGVIVQDDGSFIIFGQDIFTGNRSGYTICVNSATNELKWAELYELPTEDEINTGVSNSDGSIILGGTRFDAGTSSNPRSLLIKYDADGNLTWDKTGDILSQPRISSMVRLTNSTINIIGSNSISIIDNEGNPSFTKNFTLNLPSHFFFSIDKIASNVIASGFYNDAGETKPFIVEFDPQGEIIYEKSYENEGTFGAMLGAVDYNVCNNILIGYDLDGGIGTPIVRRVDKQGNL